MRVVFLPVVVLIVVASLTFGGGVFLHKTSMSMYSPSAVQAPTNPILEFSVPLKNAGPLSIASSPDGTFWIAEFTAGAIARFFPSNGSFVQLAVPETHSLPTYVTLDPIGNIWFSDQKGSGSIWMFDPHSLNFSQHVIPTDFSYPVGVLVDKQGNVWFAEDTGNKLGELVYPAFSIQEFALPNQNSGPAELALSHDGSAIWLTESIGERVAIFNITTHSFREYTPTIPFASPVGIVLDQSNNVWVSEHGGSSIVKLDPLTGVFEKFPTSLPSAATGYANSAPATLVIDKQGRLWFVEHFSNKVGRLDPTNKTIDEFEISIGGAYSVLSAVDSKGNFWFTEYEGNRIGEVLANSTLPVEVEALGVPPSFSAGQASSAQFTVKDVGSSPVRVQLSPTATFELSGISGASQVTLNATSIDLMPAGKATVEAKFAPSNGLSPGAYSVGVSASFGNYSSVGISIMNVTPDPTNIFLYQTLPDVLLLVILTLLIANFLVWTRRKRDSKAKLSALAVGLGTILASTLAVIPSSVRPVVAKCPGLPGLNPSAGGIDYVGLVLDIIEVAGTVLLAYLLFRGLYHDFRHRKSVKESEDVSGRSTK